MGECGLSRRCGAAPPSRARSFPQSCDGWVRYPQYMCPDFLKKRAAASSTLGSLYAAVAYEQGERPVVDRNPSHSAEPLS